jgi:AmiR/NasT family two-component response regulator
MTDVISVSSIPDDSEALRLEVSQLRTALTTRPEIEQAKGVLMALHGCDADAAFRKLVHESQTKNMKLYEVALGLLDRVQNSES